MYHVSIGNYKVNQGETLPTKDLGEDYEILWDSDHGKLYTVLLLDNNREYPFVHLYLTNVRNGEANFVVDYLPLSQSSETHRYSLYLFEQSCTFYPSMNTRSAFDLEKMLYQQSQRGCPQRLIDKMSFYGVSDPLKKKIDAFSERYDTSKFEEEDYHILGELYGMSNAKTLKPEEIKEKINKILLFKRTP